MVKMDGELFSGGEVMPEQDRTTASSSLQNDLAGRHLDFLSQAFQPSAIPFLAVDAKRRLLAFNQAFCQLSGYSAQELGRLDMLTHLTPRQWHPLVEEAWTRLAATGAPQRYERELLRKDGDTVPVEMFVHQMLDRQGNLLYHWSICLDISDRKKNEQALKESEAFARSMVEAFDGYIYVCGPDNRVEFMNERMVQRVGRDAGGERCFEALHNRREVCPWCQDEERFQGKLARREVQSPEDGRWWDVVDAPILHADGTLSKQVMIQDITARKQAEHALKESEAKFRTLTETTASAIFIIQGESIRYINRAGQRLCGYSQEELAGLRFWDIVHPDDRELVRGRGLTRQSGQEVATRYEFRLRTKDGEEIWADFTGGLIEYQGKPAILGTAFDITAHKRASADLQNSQQRLSDLINFLPDPTFAVDLEGRLIAWNKAMEEITGAPAAQMLGQGDHAYALPFYDQRRPALVDLALAWNDDIARYYPNIVHDNHTLLSEVFVPHLRPGGVYLWAKASPLWDSQGRVVGAIEVVRDITPRKQMEDALRESADKHQALVHSLPVGVITLDSQFRVTELNLQGEIITGIPEKEALGKFCWEVLQGGECQKNCPLKNPGGPERQTKPVEGSIMNPQRGRIPVRVSAAKLIDPQGQVAGGVEVFQDISEIKALERERANIVSMFAHDMKSPLVSIQGFAMRLLGEAAKFSSDKQGKYLDIIRKEAAKLEALINDFLDFARLETGNLKLKFGPTDLAQELAELIEVMQPRFQQAGMSLLFPAPTAIPSISADAARLRRVFTNLLENALKYSPDGGTVAVEVENNASEVAVRVSDEGIGIAPDELPKVFDVFYRSRSQEKREGHGLGLAGVEAIVKGHGGRVMVTSELGRGSVFTVFLPKRASAE